MSRPVSLVGADRAADAAAHASTSPSPWPAEFESIGRPSECAVGEAFTLDRCGEVKSAPGIPPQLTVSEVADRFSANIDLDALAVVDPDKGQPIGLVERTQLLLKLAHQFGHALYGQAPITRIAREDCLLVRCDERVDHVLGRVMERDPDRVYEPIVAVDEDGRYAGLISVRQLVVQQSALLAESRAQRALADERAAELERVDRTRSQLISNVTHELRAPVNAIVQLIEVASAAHQEGEQDEVGEMLKLAQRSAASLRGLVNNILDLSKIRAGKLQIVPEAIDVPALLSEIASTTRALLGDKQVEVSLEDAQVDLRTDAIMTRQILTNLASNAAKFTDCGHIHIGVRSGEGMAHFFVEDTGIGIPLEHRDQLFDPFFQVEDPAVKRREGTGLGLAIVRTLVSQLGGMIGVESKPGEGSRFSISIPLEPTDSTASARA